MPEIAQSFTVAFPREQVWRMFRDTALVVGCMPGASLDGPPEDGRLRGQMRVRLGPIAAAFAGEAELTMDDVAYRGVIRGQGLDRKTSSRTRGDVAFSLSAQDAGTRVEIKVDYALSGALAQFGRGAIVQEIAQRLTAEFAGNLTAALQVAGGRGASGTAAAAAPTAAPASATPPVARELNLWALLRSVLAAWIRRALVRLRGGKDSPA